MFAVMETTMPACPASGSRLPSGAARPPATRETFTTDDPEAAAEYLAAAYDRSLRMSRLRGIMRYVRVDTGRFAIDDVDLPLDLEFAAESLGLLVADVRSGELARMAGRAHDTVGAGDVLLSAVPETTWRGRSRDLDVRVVRLDTSVLHQVAPAPPGTPGPIRFTGHRPVGPGAALHWKRTVSYLNDLLAAPDALSPLVLGNAARLVAASVLATFPNTALLDPVIKGGNDAHPRVLRRAIAFMEENAQADIGVADVAEAAHVTVRAIQLAFRRHLDTTPTNYLRRVRLAHAHRDLRTADPADGLTVTAVAARWGFGHPGRFAAAYRAAYGESPRTTLYS